MVEEVLDFQTGGGRGRFVGSSVARPFPVFASS